MRLAGDAFLQPHLPRSSAGEAPPDDGVCGMRSQMMDAGEAQGSWGRTWKGYIETCWDTIKFNISSN